MLLPIFSGNIVIQIFEFDYCCGATEGSEQQHNQDLKEIYIRGDEFSNSSFTHLLHEFVGNVKCRMD